MNENANMLLVLHIIKKTGNSKTNKNGTEEHNIQGKNTKKKQYALDKIRRKG